MIGFVACLVVIAGASLVLSRPPTRRVPSVALAGPVTPLRGSPMGIPSNVLYQAEGLLRGGIGVVLTQDAPGGTPKVAKVAAGSPAARSGIREGDLITHVNGTVTRGVPLNQVAGWLRGFNVTKTELTIQRGEAGTNFVVQRVSFTRATELIRQSP